MASGIQGTPAGRIAVPLHFMCPAALIWPELDAAPAGAAIPDSRLDTLCRLPVECWVLRTYYHLRPHAQAISLGPKMQPNRVNIANVYDLGRRQRLGAGFVVTTQGDGYRSALGNFNIRQNGIELASPTQDWVPMWLQPGIRSRLAERGTTLTRVAYRGHPLNLIPGLKAAPFLQALAAQDIAFDLGLRDGTDNADWNDYRDVDVVVAIRNATLADARNKPASKLVNAWAAGVPAILGPEPAYRELRKGALDYIEAGSAEEALQAILWLKKHPERYQAMVQNGLERARDFTDAVLTTRWIDLLNGPVAQAFSAWQKRSLLTRYRELATMLLEEPRRKKQYEKERDHGERLLPQLA